MTALPGPHADNGYLAEHIGLLRRSLRLWAGRNLIAEDLLPVEVSFFQVDGSRLSKWGSVGCRVRPTAVGPRRDDALRSSLARPSVTGRSWLSLPQDAAVDFENLRRADFAFDNVLT